MNERQLTRVSSPAYPLPFRQILVLALGLFASWSGWAAERPRLAESELESRLRALEAVGSDAQRFEAARSLVSGRAVSSLQVKALAQTIVSEDVRFQFALAAYPFTVDPENFYEVYDAFQSFSKVFRLHDRLTQRQGEPVPPVVIAPVPLSDPEFADILRAVRKEAFDNTKLVVARQIITSAQGRIASRQVREILKAFAFEDGRLELAKAAYDYVLDPWNYYVVYDAFAFPSNREILVRYLESQKSRPNALPDAR